MFLAGTIVILLAFTLPGGQCNITQSTEVHDKKFNNVVEQLFHCLAISMAVKFLPNARYDTIQQLVKEMDMDLEVIFN